MLPDRNPDIKGWASLPAEERKLYARFMEIYAGYLTYTDHEVGLLVEHRGRVAGGFSFSPEVSGLPAPIRTPHVPNAHGISRPG